MSSLLKSVPHFKFPTRTAFKIFLQQRVDVLVLEVGIGGRLDATNIVPSPVVCGITALGMDHMDMLGDTLPVCACVVYVRVEAWMHELACDAYICLLVKKAK